MNAASAHHHYNPDWLDDDTLVANFVARQEEFSFLRNELARTPRKGTAQHHLLVGLRGSGKTTLLKRLAVAIRRDNDLMDHLIALSFPEELYQVKNLADFWWAACDALVDELEYLEKKKQADKLITAMDQARSIDAESSNTAYKLLLQTCAGLKRRPVLLVDNLDFIFQRIDKKGRRLKDPHAPAYWEFRESLSTADSPIVIGGSTRLSEPFTGYDKAFYDFFIPKRLGKLSLTEVREVLEQLADAQGVPEVKRRLYERPSRIEALFELTGGNPRALGLIFELLRQGANSRAVEDFERLMDITTPYYKARFEDLSEQAQVVMHALAVRRPGDGGGLRYGHTASEIGSHARLPTNTVSAQLDILEREGLVEKSAAHGRTQYRIAEQLFRLWLQMRSTRRIRQNVIGLTEFLEAMFDFEEMQAHVGEESEASPLSDARYAFAVAGAARNATLRKGFEAYGTERLLQYLKVESGEIRDYLPAGDLSKEIEEVVRLREQLQNCKCNLREAEQNALLGSVELSTEQKQTSVQALCKKVTANKELVHLREHFSLERQKLLRYGLLEADLPLLYNKRAHGLLPLPNLTPQEVEAACGSVKDRAKYRAMVWRLVGAWKTVEFSNEAEARAWREWGQQFANQASSSEWANVAGAMRRSGQFKQAQKTLDKAFTLGESSRAWYERGALMNASSSRDYKKIEESYRHAIELDAKDAVPWNALGNLLTKELERYKEAEMAFRKAIELDSSYDFSWSLLGRLLADKLNRYDEAESAYREAIKLNPTNVLSWFNLGDLLDTHLNRHDEAEAAFRRATELNPANAHLWSYLGGFLFLKMNRLNDAESALRKSLELDHTARESWFLLGSVLFSSDRNKDAIDVLHKGIDLNPEDGTMWLLLAAVLFSEKRFDEATEASLKAEELKDDLRPVCREIRSSILTLTCSENALNALKNGDRHELQSSLNQLITDSPDISASLVSHAFIENFLAPLLANFQYAQSVLDMMRELDYDKFARPMLLAFEAVLHKRDDMLDELEPEIQGAAKHIYGRLTGKKQKQANSIAD